MPKKDFIAQLLGLEDVILKDIKRADSQMVLFIEKERRDCTCPHCGTVTNRIHDYRTVTIKDIPLQYYQTLIKYRKRRYHCPGCGKHFNEPFSLVPKNCQISLRLGMLALNQLADTGSVSRVAKNLGISASSVFRRFRDISFRKPVYLPNVLSIDEFKGNAEGEKFQAILTDPVHGKIFDILPTRKAHRLQEYIKEFPNRKAVQFVVMDMNKVYLDLARTWMPNATVVIDKFHVARYGSWALENVRKRVQKELHPSKRKYFKRSRWLMLKHKKDLKEEDADALAVILAQSQDLATAYHLKEKFYEFIHAPTRQEAAKRMYHFKLAAEISGLKEFKACLTMLTNWSEYILNAFDHPYSNGFTEGTNNKIKVIKRNAYGYRNFENFRNRILMSC